MNAVLTAPALDWPRYMQMHIARRLLCNKNMWYFHCIVKLEEVIIKRCKTLCCFVAKWGFQKAGLSYTVKPPVQPQVYRVSYKGIPLCLETQLQSNINIFCPTWYIFPLKKVLSSGSNNCGGAQGRLMGGRDPERVQYLFKMLNRISITVI